MDKEGRYQEICSYVDHVVICQECGLSKRYTLSVAIWDCQNRLQKTSHLRSVRLQKPNALHPSIIPLSDHTKISEIQDSNKWSGYSRPHTESTELPDSHLDHIPLAHTGLLLFAGGLMSKRRHHLLAQGRPHAKGAPS